MTATTDRDNALRAIAYVAVRCRPHGAQRWDVDGVVAALRACPTRSLGSLTIAAIQAAEDRGALTPGVIPKPGPHWRDPETAPPPTERPSRGPFCGTCGRAEDAHTARDHTFERPGRPGQRPDTSALAAQVRAALATVAAPLARPEQPTGPAPRCGHPTDAGRPCGRGDEHTGPHWSMAGDPRAQAMRDQLDGQLDDARRTA